MSIIIRNLSKNHKISAKFLASGVVAFVMAALPLHADTYLPQELSTLQNQLRIGEDAETKQSGKAMALMYSNQQGCADRGGTANLDGTPGCRPGGASAELESAPSRSLAVAKPLADKIRVVASAPETSCAIRNFNSTQPPVNVAENVSNEPRPALAENGVYLRPVLYQPVVFSQKIPEPLNNISNFVKKVAYDPGPIVSSMPVEVPGGQGNNQAAICESNEDGAPACAGQAANSRSGGQGLANMEFEGGGTTAGPGGQPGAWARPKSGPRSLGNPNTENPNQEVNQRKPTNDQDPNSQDSCGQDGALNFNCQGG